MNQKQAWSRRCGEDATGSEGSVGEHNRLMAKYPGLQPEVQWGSSEGHQTDDGDIDTPGYQ